MIYPAPTNWVQEKIQLVGAQMLKYKAINKKP
jgi:hypothetical protein